MKGALCLKGKPFKSKLFQDEGDSDDLSLLSENQQTEYVGATLAQEEIRAPFPTWSDTRVLRRSETDLFTNMPWLELKAKRAAEIGPTVTLDPYLTPLRTTSRAGAVSHRVKPQVEANEKRSFRLSTLRVRKPSDQEISGQAPLNSKWNPRVFFESPRISFASAIARVMNSRPHTPRQDSPMPSS